MEEFFHQQILKVVEQWIALADERLEGSGRRCYVCPGNDNSFEIDDVIRRSRNVQLAEGRAIELGDGFSMISTGWSNVTPWKTFRECSEPEMTAKIEAMIPPSADMRADGLQFPLPALPLEPGRGTRDRRSI